MPTPSISRPRLADFHLLTIDTSMTMILWLPLELSTTWYLHFLYCYSCRAKSLGKRSTNWDKVFLWIFRTQYIWSQTFSLLVQLVHHRRYLLTCSLPKFISSRSRFQLPILHWHPSLHHHPLHVLPLLFGHVHDGLHDLNHRPQHQSSQCQQLRYCPPSHRGLILRSW